MISPLFAAPPVALLAVARLAFRPVAADHGVGLVDQAPALGDAGAQLLLLLLELARLALRPAAAL